MSTDSSIKVLSLNCWGLKYVSKNRVERIRAIADVLSSCSYDIVGLQELWVHADYQYIRNAVSKVLPHSKFFYSGALGSGLAIFTRFPIVETSIRPYALNGSPLDVAGGDFFVGKSVVSAVVEHPLLGEIEVFNTHMYAKGGDAGEEWRRAHRIVGALQFANLVRTAASRGRHIIATGDFNSIPASLAITIIRSHGGLTDAWTASHDSSLFPTESVYNPQHAIRDFGITADSPLNSFSESKSLDATAKRWQGKRLDYVFYRSKHAPSDASTAVEQMVCTNSQVVFTGRVPGRNFSFSDHFGLEATLVIRRSRPPSVSSNPPGSVGFPVDMAHSGFGGSASASQSVSGIPLSEFWANELTIQSINTALSALSIAYRDARRRGYLQLVGFVAVLLFALGLVVGSAWQPQPGWNPLLVLVAVVAGWAGTTLLYTGFIYGNYETNMLVNAIEELELMRSRRTAE